MLNWVGSVRRAAHLDGVRWAVAIGFGAFLFAALFVSFVAQPPISSLDGVDYHRAALRLASEFQFEPAGYPYPLYPALLAVVYAMGGDYLTTYYVQAVLFGVVAGLSYSLARLVAGHGAGLFAALLVALDVSLLGNVGLIATEKLQTLLLLLAMVVSLYAINQEKVWCHGWAGVLWGLLTLAKPVTMLWPAALFLVYFLVERKRGWFVTWVVLALAFTLTLSPWLLRNQLSAASTTIGTRYSPLLLHVLDEGESQRDLNAMTPKLKAVLADAEERGIEVGSLQFELNTLRLLRERIARSPTDYLAFVWDTFSRFWTEPPAAWPYSVYNGSSYFPRGYTEVPGYTDHARLRTVLAVLGLLSLLLLFRSKPRAATLISVFLLYYAMLYTMTHFVPRYSAPVTPLILVGAAVFPMLARDALRGKFADFRILSNVFLAAIVVALVAGVSVNLFLQRPNSVEGGSFETKEAEEEWTFVEEVGQPRAPLVVDKRRARDGFRAAVLELGLDRRGGETRMRHDVPVWFEGKYRLTFSYLVLQESGEPPLYVEVLEWRMFDEGGKRVIKELQPIVTNTWMDQEYEFLVSDETHTVSIYFGLFDHPGTVLIDDVRLELVAALGEVIVRPYLLQNPEEVNRYNYLPLAKWVMTQPEANRELLRSNAGLARTNDWQGGEGTLERVAYGVGIGVLVVWVFLSAVCARLRVVQRIVDTKLPEGILVAAMGVIVMVQAATCYLLLFSHPV